MRHRINNILFCTSCFDLFYLSSNQCLCIDGYYLNQSLRDKCNVTCKTCSGPDDNNCLSCFSRAKLKSNFSCVCDLNYFMKSGICLSCYSACSTCFDNIQGSCTSCKEGLILSDSGFCSCPVPNYWDESLKACVKCSEFCLRCNVFNISGCEFCHDSCFFCNEYSIYANNSCKCIEGYFEKNQTCFKCHETCKSCNDSFYYSCLSCNNSYLSGGMCLDDCPLGYKARLGICILAGTRGEVMKFEFDYFSEKYIDAVSGFEISSPGIENFYLPSQVYGRGLYFNGANSSASIKSSKKDLFSDEFLLSFWINPIAFPGSLIKSTDLETQITDFSVILYQSEVRLQFVLGTLSFLFLSNSSFTESKWTLVNVCIGHNSPTSAFIQIDSDVQTWKNIYEEPFKPHSNSSIILGYDTEHEIILNAFLYRLEVIRNTNLTTSYTSNTCSGCSCLPGGECIAACNISEFYDEKSKRCKKCQSECKTGCRHPSTCSMCFQKECLSCYDFNFGSCKECIAGFELSEGKCKRCEGTVFYDSLTKKCEKCLGLCITCLSAEECLTCEENSEVKNKACVCSLGYQLNITICERIMFKSEIKINQDNTAKLIFSEPLSKDLNKEDIIALYNYEPCKFTVNMISSDIASVQCQITWDVRLGSAIQVEFIKSITSAQNSLLETKNLSIGLFPTQTASIAAKIKEAKDFASKGTTVGTSISLCLSVASFDISSLFSFVNFAEIFSVISLYELDLDENIQEFLRSVRIQKSLPNIFEKYLTNSLDYILDQRFVKYGYKSNSMIINSGQAS